MVLTDDPGIHVLDVADNHPARHISIVYRKWPTALVAELINLLRHAARQHSQQTGRRSDQ